MIRKIITVVFFIIATSIPVFSQTDTIHWSDDTILISNDFYLPDTALLLIDPGVTVYFTGYYKIFGRGRIEAIGTESDSIQFTINDTTGFYIEDTTLGGWHGFRFSNGTTNDSSFFSFCQFHYGKAYEFPGFYTENNYGGGIYCDNFNNLIVTNCSFINNFARTRGAGIYVSNCMYLKVDSCSFINNNTKFSGGGIYSEFTKTDILNSFFYKNIAFKIDTSYIIDPPHDTVAMIIGYGGEGAAFFVGQYPSPYFRGIGNRIFNCKNIGGSIYTSCQNFIISNNLVANCEGYAYWDGFGWYSEGEIINNTFVNNDIPLDFQGGVWSISHSDSYVVQNNIIWGNTCGIGPYQLTPGLPAKYNCIQDGYSGDGNISDVPQFVNPTPGPGLAFDGLSADWTLMEDSPCINAGTPDTTGLNIPAADITGNPRIFGNRIDMGAYENQTVWVKVNNAPVADNINIYPNPGNDKINISLPGNNTPVWFDMSDATGQTVIHTRLYNELSVVYPQNLPAGIYFYRVYDEEKVIKSGKWVKR